MAFITTFLTGLLSSIIRPIIQEEINKLTDVIQKALSREAIYKKYDQEATELIDLVAKANTPEERWAYVQTLKDKRASLGV